MIHCWVQEIHSQARGKIGIGFTGSILQGLAGPLNSEQGKQLHMVYGSAKHLLALINDVLDISKIKVDPLEIASEPFDVRAAIEKAMRTVTVKADPISEIENQQSKMGGGGQRSD